MDIQQIINVNIKDMAKTWLKFNKSRRPNDEEREANKNKKNNNNKKSFTNIEQLFAAV